LGKGDVDFKVEPIPNWYCSLFYFLIETVTICIKEKEGAMAMQSSLLIQSKFG
jgi:hypothetical protein